MGYYFGGISVGGYASSIYISSTISASTFSTTFSFLIFLISFFLPVFMFNPYNLLFMLSPMLPLEAFAPTATVFFGGSGLVTTFLIWTLLFIYIFFGTSFTTFGYYYFVILGESSSLWLSSTGCVSPNSCVLSPNILEALSVSFKNLSPCRSRVSRHLAISWSI